MPSLFIYPTKVLDDDYWNVVWMRRLDNGVFNPYESINVTFSRSDLSVVFLNRFHEEVNTTQATLTKKEA